MINFVDEIREQLEKAQQEEVLSTIVMILEFYTSKYNTNIDTTLSLVKKGYKKYLELLKESE